MKNVSEEYCKILSYAIAHNMDYSLPVVSKTYKFT